MVRYTFLLGMNIERAFAAVCAPINRHMPQGRSVSPY